MSKKLYFRLNDEFCHNLEYHREYMQEHDLKELLLIEAKRGNMFLLRAGKKNLTTITM